MKPIRKPISKKLRFEIFKRDAFTCQYCGRSAPEIILEVDHINPVSKGGTGDILNLLTSCKDCNAGKRDRKLSDTSEVKKQLSQIKDLNERRLQLEMMLEWRSGLSDIRNQSVIAISKAWSENLKGCYSLNEEGKRTAHKLLKKYSLSDILEAIESATSQYVIFENGTPTHKSVDTAWEYVRRICGCKRMYEEKPWMKDVFYLRGILRNRISYVDERRAKELLVSAIELNADISSLKNLVLTVSTWTKFRDTLENYISQHEGDK